MSLIFSAYIKANLSSPISMTSISSQSSVGSGKSRRFLKLKLSLPVSSASLKHLSNGTFPDMVGFTCYKGNIGTLSRHLFRRLADILEVPQPRASTAHGSDSLPISLWGLRGILASSRVSGFRAWICCGSQARKWNTHLVINLNKKLTLWFCFPWSFEN